MSSNLAPPPLPLRKRMVICMDGTGNNCIETNKPQTNVVRLGRCVADVGYDGVPQQVYYHYGIGNSINWVVNRGVEQATGLGIDNHLLHAYHYICLNYTHPEDEIYLVGFSRGAYTAYLLAAFICRVGILTKAGLSQMNDLHKLWVKYGKNPSIPMRPQMSEDEMGPLKEVLPDPIADGTDSVDDAVKVNAATLLDDAICDLDHLQQIRVGIKVEACVLWDTVGALAIPAFKGIEPWKSTAYEFVEDRMPSGIRNVFHALALNEKRRDFKPVIFANAPSDTVLRQCWFLGSHSNVGGGYDDFALSNISLAWMIAQLVVHTRLRVTGVCSQLAPDLLQTEKATGTRVIGSRLWPWENAKNVVSQCKVFRSTLNRRKGAVGESYTGIYKMSGSKARPLFQQAKGVSTKDGGQMPMSNSPRVEPDEQIQPTQPTEEVLSQSTTRTSLRESDNVRLEQEMTIHFTVRLILKHSYGGATCPVLSDYEPVSEFGSDSLVWRLRRGGNDKATSKAELPVDTYRMMDTLEATHSPVELALLNIWFRAEREVLHYECRAMVEFRKKVLDWIKYKKLADHSSSAFKADEGLVKDYAADWIRGGNPVGRPDHVVTSVLETEYAVETTLARFLQPLVQDAEELTEVEQVGEWLNEVVV